MVAPAKKLSEAEISDIIEMALSDHTAFSAIEHQYGLKEKQVVELMRKNLKASSYKTWRKRVHDFGTRLAYYK